MVVAQILMGGPEKGEVTFLLVTSQGEDFQNRAFELSERGRGGEHLSKYQTRGTHITVKPPKVEFSCHGTFQC